MIVTATVMDLEELAKLLARDSVWRPRTGGGEEAESAGRAPVSGSGLAQGSSEDAATASTERTRGPVEGREHVPARTSSAVPTMLLDTSHRRKYCFIHADPSAPVLVEVPESIRPDGVP